MARRCTWAEARQRKSGGVRRGSAARSSGPPGPPDAQEELIDFSQRQGVIPRWSYTRLEDSLGAVGIPVDGRWPQCWIGRLGQDRPA